MKTRKPSKAKRAKPKTAKRKTPKPKATHAKPGKGKPAKRKSRTRSSRDKPVPGFGLTKRQMNEIGEEIYNETKKELPWWPDGDRPPLPKGKKIPF